MQRVVTESNFLFIVHLLHVCFTPAKPQVLEATVSNAFNTSLLPKRWFGGAYACHCKDNVQCDERTGACPGNKCGDSSFKWRGGVCQSGDVAYITQGDSVFSGAVEPEVVDGDPETCRTSGSSTSTIDFGIHSVRLYWIYVVRRTAEPVQLTILEGYRGQPIITDRYTPYQLDSRSTLYRLKQPMNGTGGGEGAEESYTVGGRRYIVSGLPSDLCSLDVGQGWNMAPGGQVRQSITFPLNDSLVKYPYSAANAIDSNENQSHAPACAMIDQPSPSWFELSFPIPVVLEYVRIFNVPGVYLCRLHGFKMTMYLYEEGVPESQARLVGKMDGDELDKAIRAFPQLAYNFSNFQHGEDTVTKLRLSKDDSRSDIYRKSCIEKAEFRQFGLCEMVVLGHLQCPANRFGPNCTLDCRLCKDNLCDNDFGCLLGCIGGLARPFCRECIDGLYGELCDRPCAKGCSKKGCHRITSQCHECAKRRYGRNHCSKRCSSDCTFGCDRQTGNCSTLPPVDDGDFSDYDYYNDLHPGTAQEDEDNNKYYFTLLLLGNTLLSGIALVLIIMRLAREVTHDTKLWRQVLSLDETTPSRSVGVSGVPESRDVEHSDVEPTEITETELQEGTSYTVNPSSAPSTSTGYLPTEQ